MPLRVRDMLNVDFGTLDATKNRHLIRYNEPLNKFDLVSIDDSLIVSSETLVGVGTYIPPEFTHQVEQEINVANIPNIDVDGGTW